ncbi:hypothetical protein IWZ03DRAFT_208586 [Phyllosticta citriasiana]|uniref:DUF6590 domain-containing protein n=1 Tax=Phyllosticta citriasiana TaxID=595635 RepID=A0ABR1KNX0_9PEZI
MAHLNRPIFPTAAAYLQSLAMVEPAVSESERPTGVHGGIPREPPEDLPLCLVKPSDREEFFRVGKVIKTIAIWKNDEKITTYGVITDSVKDYSTCLFIEDFGPLGTITANRREPPGSRGIIHTTPYPPDPLAGEANLLDHVFAAKPLRAPYDLPSTARVDYTTIFNARHDAPVRHVAQLDEEGLDVLCRNFREATGGCLIGAVKKENREKKAEVVDEGDEVD